MVPVYFVTCFFFTSWHVLVHLPISTRPTGARLTLLYDLFYVIFFSFEHTQCYTLAFYSWKKKSRTSRERQPRLAGTYSRVLTGEGNFLKVQTPGLTWGSQQGQDTCAVLYLYSLQRALLLQVFTPNIYLFQISQVLQIHSAVEELRYSRFERKRHDRTLISILYGELLHKLQIYLQ